MLVVALQLYTCTARLNAVSPLRLVSTFSPIPFTTTTTTPPQESLAPRPASTLLAHPHLYGATRRGQLRPSRFWLEGIALPLLHVGAGACVLELTLCMSGGGAGGELRPSRF